jgi:hypothetical protein
MKETIEITGAAFYDFLAQHQLMGSRCRSCGTLYLPPRPLCTECYADALDGMEWVEMSGAGELLAFTTVHIATTPMTEAGYGRDNPYCSGIVRLAEGPAISAQILGVDPAQPQAIAIGTVLQVAFVQREDGKTYLAFEVEED